VTYVDPELGSVTKTFYGSSVDATTQKFRNGEVYWENTSFSLIER
jgi:flagellum-specific peptidoglycan hydrolase FlgJ